MKAARYAHPDAQVIPAWVEGVPRCDEDCPLHDGKRCELLGHRAPSVCEPMVKAALAPPADNDPCRECGSMSLLIMGRRLRRALLDIGHERGKQDTKWGDTKHPPEIYLAILMEEVGELSTAILSEATGGRGNIRDELVQVAAVAARMIELCDRRVEGWVR